MKQCQQRRGIIPLGFQLPFSRIRNRQIVLRNPQQILQLITYRTVIGQSRRILYPPEPFDFMKFQDELFFTNRFQFCIHRSSNNPG